MKMQAIVNVRTDLLFTIVRPELHHVAYNLPGLKTMKELQLWRNAPIQS